MTTDYGTVRAPEFPRGLRWFNTEDQPLTLEGLRDKFVLLDFWTYCCINCLHILPELERLEGKYLDELVVIGIHSGKFDNERDDEQIREAIRRYGIEHPVVNDRDMVVWQQYAVRAWPTVFLLDPDGYIVGHVSGEGIFEPVDEKLRELIPRHRERLNRRPVVFQTEAETERSDMLSFPGKIYADPQTSQLFIADTNNHRVLIANKDGVVKRQIGSGRAGLADGTLNMAEFRNPQGLFFFERKNILFVADTGNHAIRRIDLTAGRVLTLTGNGRQAKFGQTKARGPESSLSSPWDLTLLDGTLYVAMAGLHQIWQFDPETGHGSVYAGDGLENIVDGPRLDAELAQPSAITSGGDTIFFIDSETSSVRRLDIGDEAARVETIIGTGLFEFGDADGQQPEARLQHPLGIAYSEGRLFVADSYNHKIKAVDDKLGAVATLCGTGEAGFEDGDFDQAQFDEPSGISLLGDTLYVADTNNHRIRTIDLRANTVRTLELVDALPGSEKSTEEPVKLPPQHLKPGRREIVVKFQWPKGYKLNQENPGFITVHAARPDVLRFAADETGRVTDDGVRFTAAAEIGDTDVMIGGAAYYCDSGNGRCLIYPVNFRLPLIVRGGSENLSLTVRVAVQAPY